MTLLIVGLVLFLGFHSVQIFAAPLRAGLIARIGANGWKGLYSLGSLAGLVLLVIGYGQAKSGAPLIALPASLSAVTYVLVWLGFVLTVAAYWPANHFKAVLGHPMVAGVGLWALGHLLVRPTPAGMALFGGFLVWAIVDFISLRARPGGVPAASPTLRNTALTVVVGTFVWAIFLMFLHTLVAGVAPRLMT